MNKYIMGIVAVLLVFVAGIANSIAADGEDIALSGSNIIIIDGKVITGSGVEGSGVSKTENREPGIFKKINLDISADVDARKGDKARVRITADDNILPLISTEVKNGILTISSKKSYAAKVSIRIQIQAPEITQVILSGSGNIFLDSVSDKELSLIISGTGDIRAVGSVDDLVSKVEGSGNLKLKGLKAKNCEISIDGSGDAEVFVTGSLDARISGSGDITYYGNPKKVGHKIHGVGDITRGD